MYFSYWCVYMQYKQHLLRNFAIAKVKMNGTRNEHCHAIYCAKLELCTSYREVCGGGGGRQ